MTDATPAPAVPQPSAVPANPGATMGIVGLILSIFFSFIGIIVSAIALKKSKAAGMTNGVAVAGIIVGVITTIILVITIVSIVGAGMAFNAAVGDMEFQ